MENLILPIFIHLKVHLALIFTAPGALKEKKLFLHTSSENFIEFNLYFVITGYNRNF